MGNLERFLPAQSPIADKIMEWWERTGLAQPRRNYLGASEIGEPCGRRLWYKFRWCVDEKFPGRMYRLFDRGQREEAAFVKDLRAIGCEVHDVDENGNQFAIEDCNGHFRGHMDGVALGIPTAEKTWHLLEFKTHSAKSFRKLRSGVQVAHPKHYAQMQVYMRKGELTRALYMAVNKDDDSIHAERVRLDIEFADKLLEKAQRIIESPVPPHKCGTGYDDEVCKYCPAKTLCHGNPLGMALPCDVSCRNCAWAEPGEAGRWKCNKRGRYISYDEQKHACEDHRVIPELLPFATVIDFTDDHSLYMNEADSSSWAHGKGDGEFTSKELTRTPVEALHGKSATALVALKAKMGAEVVGEVK